MTLLTNNQKEMQVYFVPFNGSNPYQTQLGTGLTKRLVNIHPVIRLKDVLSLKKDHPDSQVIHIHWLPKTEGKVKGWLFALLFIQRLETLRRQGHQIVWTLHNLYGHEAASSKRERWMAKKVFQKSSRLIAHTPSSRELLRKEFGTRDIEKVAVIPHGNYVEVYKNKTSQEESRNILGLNLDATVFLFLGHIRPYKGVAELITAFKQLDDPKAILVVAGSPLNTTIAHSIQQLAAEDSRIILKLEAIPDVDLQTYFNAADVAVFPYRQILTSGALILAMSFARACIAPRLGALPETVEDQVGAFLYDPNDKEGLLLALEEALHSKANLRTMGQKNLERAQQWDWDSIAQETYKIYQEVLG